MSGIRTYIEETVHELTHKVSWPTWSELQSSAIIVLIASFMIAFMVFAMDWIFGIQGGVTSSDEWKGILGYIYGFFY